MKELNPLNPFVHRYLSCKLLTQFPRYSGNRNRAFRFSQDEYNIFFSKQKHETVFFRNYKKFDNSAFREALNRELIKYDLNNIEYDTFQEIIVSLLNVYAPLKKKYLRANHASFVTKELRKAIMERTRLRNIYLKQRTETTKVAYNQQRNKCVSILKKTKRSYFESLDVKFVKGNKKFWKKISPLFSNKIKSKEKIALVENNEI